MVLIGLFSSFLCLVINVCILWMYTLECPSVFSNVCFLINTDGKTYNKYAGILHTGNWKHHIETGFLLRWSLFPTFDAFYHGNHNSYVKFAWETEVGHAIKILKYQQATKIRLAKSQNVLPVLTLLYLEKNSHIIYVNILHKHFVRRIKKNGILIGYKNKFIKYKTKRLYVTLRGSFFCSGGNQRKNL